MYLISSVGDRNSFMKIFSKGLPLLINNYNNILRLIEAKRIRFFLTYYYFIYFMEMIGMSWLVGVYPKRFALTVHITCLDNGYTLDQ